MIWYSLQSINLPPSTLSTTPCSWTKFWSPRKRRKSTKSKTRRVLQLPKALIEGLGKNNSMDNVAKRCANICGVQFAIVNITAGKPLLYQYAWKMIHFIENKHFTCWHVRNAQSLAHLPILCAHFPRTASIPTWSSTAITPQGSTSRAFLLPLSLLPSSGKR